MPFASIPGRSPLVGRASEIRLLNQHLDTAKQGHGHAVLLSAPAGMGKSRLLQEVAVRAEQQGFQTCTGRAFELEADFPYAIIADALPQYLHAARDAGGGATSKLALFEGFVTFLKDLAAARPLLLMLDDVHWADPASLELIHYAARQIDRVPVLLLMACRSDEPHDTLQGLIRGLSRAGLLSLIMPGPLGEPEVAELMRQILGAPAPPSPELTAQLSRETGGNPFFLEETVKAMVQARALVEQGGIWRQRPAERLAVPRSIRDAILSRLTRLVPAERRLLDTVAVFGGRIPFATLRALSDMPEAELFDVLDRLLRLQILGEEGSAYKLAHPKIQQTLYEELSAARRQALHGFIATRLERVYEGERHADELALHFGLAGDAEHLARSIAYDIRAGDRAAALFAYDRAAAVYLRALLHDEQAGGLLPADQLLELLDKLGTVYEKIGDFTAAAEFWDQALTSADAGADPERIATLHRNLARVHWEHGDGARALRYCEQGLAMVHRDEALTAALHHERFAILLRHGGATQAAEAVGAEAAAAAESGGDRALATARADRAALALWTGDVAGAVENGSAALDLLLRDSGAADVCYALHITLAWALWGMGRHDEAREHAGKALALTDRYGLHALQGTPLLILSLMELQAGRAQDALALARQAVEVQRAHKSPALGLPLAVLALATTVHGDADAAAAVAAEAESMTERYYAGAPSLEGMLAYATLGHTTGTAQHFSRAADLMAHLRYRFMAVVPVIGLGPGSQPAAVRRPDGLTKRELDVIREVCRHKTDKEIAAALHLSVRTVSTHLTHIYTKLNIHGRTELVAYGLRVGLDLGHGEEKKQ